jgi:carbonic anhydrase
VSKLKKISLILCVSLLIGLLLNHRVQFILGGAMINVGYRFQDHIKHGVAHPKNQTPNKMWKEIKKQNKLASSIRSMFPRTTHRPKVAILLCMDARLDDDELTGDSRQLYYIIRTAGSVLPKVEQDMLELSIEKGVEVVVLTTHEDCAAEKASKDKVMSKKLPYLCDAVKHRKKDIQDFLSRPSIKEKIESGKLIIVNAHIDTANGMLVPDTK